MASKDDESSDYGEFRFARNIRVYGKDGASSSSGSLVVHRNDDEGHLLVLRVVAAGKSDDDRSNRCTADATTTDARSSCEVFEHSFDAREANASLCSFVGDDICNDDPLTTVETWLADGTSGKDGDQSQGAVLAKFRRKDDETILVTILVFVSDQNPQRRWSASIKSTKTSASYGPLTRSLIGTIQMQQAAADKISTEMDALKEDRDGYKYQVKLMSDKWDKEKTGIVTNFFELYEAVQEARDEFKRERDAFKEERDSLRKMLRMKGPESESAMQVEPERAHDTLTNGMQGAEPDRPQTSRAASSGVHASSSARAASKGRPRKVHRTEMSEADLFRDDDPASEVEDLLTEIAGPYGPGASRAKPPHHDEKQTAGGTARTPASVGLGVKRSPAPAAANARSDSSTEDDTDESDANIPRRRAGSTVPSKHRTGRKSSQRHRSSSEDDSDALDSKLPALKAGPLPNSKHQAGSDSSRRRGRESAKASQTSRSTQRMPARTARESHQVAATGDDDDSDTDVDKAPIQAKVTRRVLNKRGDGSGSDTDVDTNPNQSTVTRRPLLGKGRDGSSSDDSKEDAKKKPASQVPAFKPRTTGMLNWNAPDSDIE